MEQVVRAAIQAGAGHNVVADLRQVHNGQRFGSLTTTDQQRCYSAFKGGNALFHNRLGGVHDAGVDVAEFGQAEQRRCVVGVTENVRGGRVNRQSTCTRCGVSHLAGVNLLGFKTPAVVHGLVFS
ncbi:unannotated protein [freshwater metagenome]|uniref:Unannotated protein n=1 Tax=freshwater metagenome TaxID=449393 RepID=A0A6J6W9P0_9ZZZZ